MSDVLEPCEAGESAADDMADQLFKEQVIHNLEGQSSSCLPPGLIRKTKRQLVKGQDVDVEQGKTLFDGKQPANAVG
jgi:hypothetical protein